MRVDERQLRDFQTTLCAAAEAICPQYGVDPKQCIRDAADATCFGKFAIHNNYFNMPGNGDAGHNVYVRTVPTGTVYSGVTKVTKSRLARFTTPAAAVHEYCKRKSGMIRSRYNLMAGLGGVADDLAVLPHPPPDVKAWAAEAQDLVNTGQGGSAKAQSLMSKIHSAGKTALQAKNYPVAASIFAEASDLVQSGVPLWNAAKALWLHGDQLAKSGNVSLAKKAYTEAINFLKDAKARPGDPKLSADAQAKVVELTSKVANLPVPKMDTQDPKPGGSGPDKPPTINTNDKGAAKAGMGVALGVALLLFLALKGSKR